MSLIVMAVPKRKQKTFYATMHVTRVEHWCVEAETEEEAREMLMSGGGYRCEVGNCVYTEIERVEY